MQKTASWGFLPPGSEQGMYMGGSIEAITGKASISPGLIETTDWLAEAEWLSEPIALSAAVFGVSAYHLVGVDLEGTAHALAGTLPRKSVSARVLEALESPDVWDGIVSARAFSAISMSGRSTLWPKRAALGCLLFKQDDKPLGALLFKRGPDAATTDDPVDRLVSEVSAESDTWSIARSLIVQVLYRWRMQRDARAMGEFTRGLIAAQQCGVIAIDTQGRVTYLNQRAQKILGIESEKAIGADCTRVIRPSADGEHPMLKGLAGECEELELYISDSAGNNLAVAMNLSRMTDGAGNTEGLVCLLRDFTEERAAEQEYRRRERLAVIGELAAGAAHEIRNPLTGIGNCAQVLQMRLGEQDRERKMADTILHEAQRLEQIITSLLGFARPGPPSLREVQLEDVVRDALELEQPVYEKRGARCELRVVGMIPAIYVDPGQIRQVIINLMRNGVDAMADGGLLLVEVSVVKRHLHGRRKLGRRATDKVHVPSHGPQARFVRIRVKDTGNGIPQEKLLRIFDPFFTTRSEGTGLGLSVSQSIVQEHGGFISVQSVEKRGSVFDVDLPIERRQGERRRD
jgi:PAS domain S-box-containing protein